LPLADAVALTFAGPLFLTALSLADPTRAGRPRALDLPLRSAFLGVLIWRIRVGPANWLGMVTAILCAVCNAVGTLTVRGLTRTEATASIVFYTALFMTLMALPALPFFWVTPSPLDFLLLLLDRDHRRVSQYWTNAGTLLRAGQRLVSPFNYTALIWGSILGYWCGATSRPCRWSSARRL